MTTYDKTVVADLVLTAKDHRNVSLIPIVGNIDFAADISKRFRRLLSFSLVLTAVQAPNTLYKKIVSNLVLTANSSKDIFKTLLAQIVLRANMTKVRVMSVVASLVLTAKSLRHIRRQIISAGWTLTSSSSYVRLHSIIANLHLHSPRPKKNVDKPLTVDVVWDSRVTKNIPRTIVTGITLTAALGNNQFHKTIKSPLILSAINGSRSFTRSITTPLIFRSSVQKHLPRLITATITLSAGIQKGIKRKIVAFLVETGIYSQRPRGLVLSAPLNLSASIQMQYQNNDFAENPDEEYLIEGDPIVDETLSL